MRRDSPASGGRQLVIVFPSSTGAVNTASEGIGAPRVYGSVGLAPRAESKMWAQLESLPRTVWVIKMKTPRWEEALNKAPLM